MSVIAVVTFLRDDNIDQYQFTFVVVTYSLERKSEPKKVDDFRISVPALLIM